MKRPRRIGWNPAPAEDGPAEPIRGYNRLHEIFMVEPDCFTLDVRYQQHIEAGGYSRPPRSALRFVFYAQNVSAPNIIEVDGKRWKRHNSQTWYTEDKLPVIQVDYQLTEE